MDTEAIEQSFASAGWEIDRSFSEYLIIGYNGDGLSILAHPEAGEPEGPVFELIDHERNLTYGVQEIPTPQQAAQILQGHGQPPRSRTTTSSKRRLRRAPKPGATYFYLLV